MSSNRLNQFGVCLNNLSKKNNYGRKASEYEDLIKKSFKNISPSQIAHLIRRVVRDLESPYLLKFNIIEIPVNNEHNYSLNFVPNSDSIQL